MKLADSIRTRPTMNWEGDDFSRAASSPPLPLSSDTGGMACGTVLRWLKFNAVGVLGIAVQLVVLLALKSGFHFNYLLATALAVEAAVVHNFLWHERYTWADRVQPSWSKSLPRLLRFNLTTGAVSIAGNLAFVRVLVGPGHMNYMVASGIAIVLCSLANFLISDRVVFAFVSRSKEAR